MTVRPLSGACGHGTEMLLILKKTIFDLIIHRYDEGVIDRDEHIVDVSLAAGNTFSY